MKLWKEKKSALHGSGLFAKTNIQKNTKIIEYIGDKVLKSEGDRRSSERLKKYLKKEEEGSVYIFELNKHYDIDGSPLYNKARYVNHSCDPNCEVDIVDNRIWIISIKKIKKDEELTYDYGYAFDKNDYKDHICKCSSKYCIGYIISSDEWGKFKKHISNLVKKRSKKK